MEERLIAAVLVSITLCTGGFLFACMASAILSLWELTTRAADRITSRRALKQQQQHYENFTGVETPYSI